MKDRERVVVGGLVSLMLLLWLGFLFHASPRFAGSLAGVALGVSGALLMLWPLGYSVVKRAPAVKAAVTRRVSMRTLLTLHVYTGILGAVLAVVHTGHKFNNVLVVSLTTAMLLAVLTGYVGRHFMNLISTEMREEKDELAAMQKTYDALAAKLAEELAKAPSEPPLAAAGGSLSRSMRTFFGVSLEDAPSLTDEGARPALAMRLAESMADLEYAIESHDFLKRQFKLWLDLHIAASVLFYVLLALHVAAGVYFGLRWLS